ncbi:MAG: glycosyltransferase family 2 protein [Anaerolineae bacterium]|nr:glycosyltransferase family 2 protein [Anaerolineae bacterium]
MIVQASSILNEELSYGADGATPPQLSIVLPIYNEAESLPHLLEELVPALEATGRTFEIICVDDGSRDNSFGELQKLRAQDARVRVVRFRRNFGQTAAFAAGFDRARGEVVITMDADLQNDPADIPELLAKIDEGYDVVSGWRVKRWQEGFSAFLTRKVPSTTANWLISKGTGVRLHDYGCALKAYRRDVVKSINLYGDLHRFIPAIASYYGVSVAEVPVNYRSRQFGRSKYGIGRITRVILDLLTVRFLLSYSTRPIQIFGLMGLGSLALGVLIGVYLTFVKLVYFENLVDRPLLLLAILLVMVGVQFITMGLLGEMISRTYHESQNKPIYTVREELG